MAEKQSERKDEMTMRAQTATESRDEGTRRDLRNEMNSSGKTTPTPAEIEYAMARPV